MTSNRYTVKLTFDDLDAKLRRSPERQRYFTVFVSECSQAVHSNTRRSRSGSSAGSSQPHRLIAAWARAKGDAGRLFGNVASILGCSADVSTCYHSRLPSLPKGDRDVIV